MIYIHQLEVPRWHLGTHTSPGCALAPDICLTSLCALAHTLTHTTTGHPLNYSYTYWKIPDPGGYNWVAVGTHTYVCTLVPAYVCLTSPCALCLLVHTLTHTTTRHPLDDSYTYWKIPDSGGYNWVAFDLGSAYTLTGIRLSGW